MAFTVAQVSDTHLGARTPLVQANFDRVVDALDALRPDLVVASGDVCQSALKFGSGTALVRAAMNPESCQWRRRFGRGGPDRMTPSSLRVTVAPSGLIVERHEIGAEGLSVHARGAPPATVCPACRSPSSSVHSRYTRSLADFPAHGRRLTVKLTARRFRYRVASCDRKIFTERFTHDAVATHARRTSRLDRLTHGIALVLGDRPGARLAERLSMPVNANTLLRILRRRAPRRCVPITRKHARSLEEVPGN